MFWGLGGSFKPPCVKRTLVKKALQKQTLFLEGLLNYDLGAGGSPKAPLVERASPGGGPSETDPLEKRASKL